MHPNLQNRYNRLMHIVLLNDDALPAARGGAAVVVDRLRKEYARRGHTVILVTSHQDDLDIREERDTTGRIISLPIICPPGERHRRCVRNAMAGPLVRSVLADLKPDAVHAHNLHMFLTYESLEIAHAIGARTVLTAHDTYLASFGRVDRPRRLTVVDHLRAAGRKYAPGRNRAIRQVLARSQTKVVAISMALDVFLHANGIRTDAVIFNGVDPEEYAWTEEERTVFRGEHRLTGPTVLFGGRISADKGVDALLQAFAVVLEKLPRAQLLILGDRARLDPHLRNAPASVCDAVRAPGHIDATNMRLAYAAADVVTTPSLYLDPFNLMNIEAMAAGKPVVGTTMGGTPEIIADTLTGFVCDPRDTAAYAAALITALLDIQKAKSMGGAGRDRVTKFFALARQADRYLELLAA